MKVDLPILSFASGADLRAWLEHNHASSGGIFVRIYKKGTGKPTVSFEEALDEACALAGARVYA